MIHAVATDAPQVALTLDDGPDAVGTPRHPRHAGASRARATFFLLGQGVAGREALVRRIVATGNEIGNHGMREEPATDVPPDAFQRELPCCRPCPAKASPW